MLKITCGLALCAVIVLSSCRQNPTLFRALSSDRTGIQFANTIVENDSVNPIDLTNVYNGGGIGVGDFNNDGLQDLYFTGNQVANQLYINKGNLKFENVTDEAKVNGNGRWCRGVSVIDINNDGRLDLYVSASILSDPDKRQNLLYINDHTNGQGVPVFRESAAEYGLNDTTHTTMAAFFDYDNDGDLDVYLVVNEIQKGNNPSIFRPIIKDGSFPSTGRLYRNDWNDSLQHAYFTDVSKQAGVTIEGYGHGVNIADFNRDGWKDIFVTNDFISNDLLYINNHDGTFTDKITTYFKHTSANGMGQDVIDINNDGLSDVIELDMNPEDNYRKKTMMSSSNYRTYQNSDHFGYQYQYVRNSLQLNQGPRVLENDSTGDPVFSDVGFFAGVAETDWSWTPLVADFDNDGYRDIIITNGFPRDITDHDFIAFRRQSSTIASEEFILDQIPKVKIHNYAFRNNGDITFDNVTREWGLSLPSFSNGAVYADLDKDGDLDMVINNINDKAFIYQNTSNKLKQVNNNFISVKLKGDKNNLNGLGAWIELYNEKGKMQAYENSPYRGYLSSVEGGAFFGLGKAAAIDSLVVRWPGNKKQVILHPSINQELIVDIKDATLPDSWSPSKIADQPLFAEVTRQVGVDYIHQEKDYIDFDRERLLPHKLSQFGPALSASDVDGNGLDDIIVGGAARFPGKLLMQQPGARFISKNIVNDSLFWQNSENMGLLLFDADNDGDPDLYCTSGSNEFPSNSSSYQDKILVNDGKGNFSYDSTALPYNTTSKSCVKAADFDNDGDLDLFVGGRCLPGKYPLPVPSFIFRNDSKDGVIKFTDVTNTAAKFLTNIGMVCDAIWTDFDNDDWTDLIVVGEWMSPVFLKNKQGSFENITDQTGVADQKGWWNSIAGGDFDNDGDIDYIVGNLGKNSFFRASKEQPVRVYAKDFDNNGSIDPVVTVYLKDQKGIKREYPMLNRDDIIGQLPGVRKQFLTYKEFANADIRQIFPGDKLASALVLEVDNLSNCLLKNNGNGKFELQPLPSMAQLAGLNGIVIDDFNDDGNLDIASAGNDYGNEVSNGRYDAMNGLVLLGDGTGGFTPQTILQSGMFIPGDAKALVQLGTAYNSCLLAASQNRGPLKIFGLNSSGMKFLKLKSTDRAAYVTLTNGKKRKQEVYFGTSFLSQSSRMISTGKSVATVEIKEADGRSHAVNLH